MTLTPEQLAEARALVEKATAVSWTANHGSWNSNVTFTQPNPVFEGESVTGLVIQSVGRDNATFIAASRSLVPDLLDDVDALREGLREACDIASDLGLVLDGSGLQRRHDRIAALRQLLEGK